MTLIRGDRTVNTFGQPSTFTVLRTSGPLYTGKQTAIPANANQFTAIGNPFASAINFNNIIKSGGVQDIFYVWDPKLTTGYGLGAFQTFVGPGPVYFVTPGGGSYGSGNTLIESGQAFFVHTIGAGSVIIPESSKVGGSNLVFRPGGLVDQLRLNLNVSYNGNAILLDGVMSQYDPGYNNNVDAMDALKLFSQGESVAISSNGKKMVVERRQGINSGDTIYYDIAHLQQREYELEIKAQDLGDPRLLALLEDTYLHTATPVTLDGTTSNRFTVNSDPLSAASNRFRIVFKPVLVLPVTFTDISVNRNNDKSIKIKWQVDNEINITKYAVERSNDGRTFSTIDTSLPAHNNGSSANYDLDDVQLVMGDIFYRVKAYSIGGQVQYSAVAKVNGLKSASDISVYPNPVVNKAININFTNQEAGKYEVSVITGLGEIALRTVITINSNNEIYSLDGGSLTSGIYLLKIKFPGVEVKTIKVFIQ